MDERSVGRVAEQARTRRADERAEPDAAAGTAFVRALERSIERAAERSVRESDSSVANELAGARPSVEEPGASDVDPAGSPIGTTSGTDRDPSSTGRPVRPDDSLREIALGLDDVVERAPGAPASSDAEPHPSSATRSTSGGAPAIARVVPPGAGAAASSGPREHLSESVIAVSSPLPGGVPVSVDPAGHVVVGSPSRPVDSESLAALLSRLRRGAESAPRRWQIRVLNGVSGLETLDASTSPHGGWELRVGWSASGRPDDGGDRASTSRAAPSEALSDVLSEALGAALSARGHVIDRLEIDDVPRRRAEAP